MAGIRAKEILDSNNRPTIEVELETDRGKFISSVPSGVSKGKYEALESRDEDGGVKKAIENIEKIIAPVVIKEDLTDQKRIDEILINLDATKDKSRLGANATLAVSMAACRTGAAAKGVPLYRHIASIERGSASVKNKLPTPLILYLEGGLHGQGGLDIQEVMGFCEGETFKRKFEAGEQIYRNLSEVLNEKYEGKGVEKGLEGGFTPPVKDIKEALNLLIKASGNQKIKIILDAAAASSDFERSAGYYLDLSKEYPVFGVEDPFKEDEWQKWQALNEKSLVIGDDLTVTNPQRINMAHKKNLCQGVIIKPNQIGTVSEAIEAVKLAKSFGWKIIVSHRSGETTDDFIADLAVGVGADFIKTGAPFPPERMAKYDRLIKIEEEIHPVK